VGSSHYSEFALTIQNNFTGKILTYDFITKQFDQPKTIFNGYNPEVYTYTDGVYIDDYITDYDIKYGVVKFSNNSFALYTINE
jgi:hypothetical protein